MTRVDLPDGAWAELADPKKVQERKRRPYIAAIADLSSTSGSAQIELADRVGDLLIVCLVQAWSFGAVTVDAISELSADAFDVLFRACRELAPALVPDYTSADPDPKVLDAASTNGQPAFSATSL